MKRQARSSKVRQRKMASKSLPPRSPIYAGLALFGFLTILSEPASASFLSSLREWWSTSYLSDAISILAKQTAVSAQQVQVANVEAKQTLATAIQSIDSQMATKKLIIDHGLPTSTPHASKCEEIALRQASNDQDIATAATQNNQMGMQSANLWLPAQDLLTERLNTHKDLGCSIQESALGLCKFQPTGLQFIDTDYSSVAATDALTPDQKTMANMRIVNMTLPSFDRNAALCNDDQCNNERFSYLQKGTRSNLVAATMLDQINQRSLSKEFPSGISNN